MGPSKNLAKEEWNEETKETWRYTKGKAGSERGLGSLL
jgi:hypothetical protein